MEGRSFGNYEVTGQLGKGGMGEVYRAHDTRLGRDVAIKVLPPEFTADANRLARFEREARLLASLNHPNISAVYGLEELDGRQCLVLELVEGETLAERIDRGALPLDEAIEVARQIAEGVQAAHDRGVIHRDLKPANIKIDPEGQVKILDFGLAKAMSGDADTSGSFPPLSTGDSPTMTHQVTTAGVLLGTAGYMSPEQAKGKPADSRTDVWAYGCVLYEMLTGQSPFDGETITDMIAAIVMRDPKWDALPDDLPAPLRRLLRRCFQKDKHQRLQHVGDARLELQDAMAGVSDGEETGLATVRDGNTRPRLALLLVTAATALMLGALGMWVLNRSSKTRRVVPRALSINLEHPLKMGGLAARSFDLSPDGSTLVYTGLTGPAAQLYLRQMDSWGVRPIPGTEGAGDPIFSPDGEWILYTAGGRLFKVPVRGGQPIIVASSPGVPYGLDWADDGTIVLTTNLSYGFFVVSDGTTKEIPVSDTPGLFRWPEALPGGETILGTISGLDGTRRIVAVDVASGDVQELMSGSSPEYLRSGQLLYRQGETVLVVPFDAVAVQTTGPAEALPYEVGALLGKMWLTASDSGDLVYAPQEEAAQHELVWVDREGRSTAARNELGTFWGPRISPDGKRAIWSTAMSPAGDLWVHDFERDFSSRLTDEGFDSYAAWTPDGKQLIYSTDQGVGNFELFAKPADRAGGEVLLVETPNVDVAISVAPDGTLFFYQVMGETQRDVFALRTDGTIETLVKDRPNERGPSVSPDGKWFAYTSDEGGRDEVYVQPYPTDGRRWRMSNDGGAEARWAPDGSALYYRNGDALLEVSISAGSGFRPDPPQVLFRGPYVLDLFGNPGYDVAPDGRFLMVRGEDAEPAELKVVVNWFDQIR